MPHTEQGGRDPMHKTRFVNGAWFPCGGYAVPIIQKKSLDNIAAFV